MERSTTTSQQIYVNSHLLEPRADTGVKEPGKRWQSQICCILYVVYVDANFPFWAILLLNNVVLLVIEDK